MKTGTEKKISVQKQPYTRPTLDRRECLDEVRWGQLLISGGVLPPPPP